MLRASFICLLAASLSASTTAQQTKPETTTTVQSTQGTSREGFITPSDVNVHLGTDVRTFVVMAALNMAGFDYETNGQPLSPARAELRKDLAGLNPELKQKLAEFYKAHRRQGVDEAADSARYAAFSLLMTQPPGFTIYKTLDHPVPVDLEPLLGFVDLVRAFYVTSGIRELLPKYMKVAEAYAAAYRVPVGNVIFDVLDYFHAKPEMVISMKPLVITTGDINTKKEKSTVISRTRTRQVFLIADPLSAIDTSTVRGDILNQKDDLLARKVGDDYIVIVGPSRAPTGDAARQAMIRFVIDPLVERHLKASLEYRDQILRLVASTPSAAKQYSSSVYLVIRESLAQATDARMRRINAAAHRGNYSEDDAVVDLAEAYQSGAVLAFHFYEALAGLEKVGISIEDFFDQMVATTKFDREATRAASFEPIVAKVSERRSRSSKNSGAEGGAAEAAMGAMATKILASDDLIRERRYREARSILEEVLAAEPNNARALYGMAQVLTQNPSTVELDPKADENDNIQAQHDRLEKAIKLYKRVIENASKDSERWLIQWSHVFIGRIFDFQEFRADAIEEYEKAIALGANVPNGAYKEALDGKQRAFGQKQ